MKIGIISLGWLGKQIYQEALERGHEAWGSYAHSPKGLKGEVLYDISKNELPLEVEYSDWIVFNLPPSAFNLKNFEAFLEQAKRPSLLFVSSTSVYGQEASVNESDVPMPKSENGKFLHECEKMLEGRKGDSVIVRPGGLVGKDRHPGKNLSGRSVQGNPEAAVNLIEGKDLGALILDLIEADHPPLVVNAVNSRHPTKEEYYSDYCLRNKLPTPSFKGERAGSGKVVSTQYARFLIDRPLP